MTGIFAMIVIYFAGLVWYGVTQYRKQKDLYDKAKDYDDNSI